MDLPQLVPGRLATAHRMTRIRETEPMNAFVPKKPQAVTLLTLLLGGVLAAGAAYALSETSPDPTGDEPFELTCHGHGHLGPGDGPWGPGGPGWGRRGRGGPGPCPGCGGGPGPGWGGPGPGWAGGHPGAHLRILESMPGDLALTGEQWDKVLEIMAEAKTAMDPLMEQRRERRDALRDLMHADPLDEAAIRTGVMDLAQLQADMAVEMAKTRSQVVALLTADQKEYLESERERYQQRWERHHQHRELMRGGRG